MRSQTPGSRCEQCGAPRPTGTPMCTHCGWHDARASGLVLRVLGDEVPRQEWQIFEPSVEIGRGHEMAVLLRHTSVSRRHACLRRTNDGFVLEDLGSTNGTFVNGRHLDQPRRVSSGDELKFGDVSLIAELAADGVAPFDPPAVRTLLVDVEDVLGPTPPVIELTPPPARDVTLPEHRAVREPPEVAQAEPEPPPQPVLITPFEPTAPSLAEAIDRATALATALRSLGADLRLGVWLFEHAGGRAAARVCIEQMRAAEAHPLDDPPDAWSGLAESLPTARVLLEGHLILIDLLQPSLGDLTHDQDAQTDTSDQQPIARA